MVFTFYGRGIRVGSRSSWKIWGFGWKSKIFSRSGIKFHSLERSRSGSLIGKTHLGARTLSTRFGGR